MNTDNLETLCMSCLKPALAPNGFCSECGVNEGALWSAPHHLRPRSVLSERYVVGRVIGEGGFGITYVGWDTHLSVKVAIKEYYPNGCVTRDMTNGSTVYSYGGGKGEFFQMERKRFIDEAQRLTRFSDLPGIVSVKDFFEENGTAYIVMEFIEGATLKTVLTNMSGRMPEEHVLAMMKPLIRSLAEIHKAGIIHRDIAPDNIMIRPDGSVKLIDFGAAREADSEGKSNVALMKHGYTPEEQYDTDRSRQGAWTDVYALCATIFRAIEGATPPDANTRLRGDTFSGFTAPVSENTSRVITKGLAVKPDQRWQDIGELSQELYDNRAAIGGAANAAAATPVVPAEPTVSTTPAAPPVEAMSSQPLQMAPQGSADKPAGKLPLDKKWVKLAAIGGGGLVALILIVIGIVSLIHKPALQQEAIPVVAGNSAPNALSAEIGSPDSQTQEAESTPESTPVPALENDYPEGDFGYAEMVTSFGKSRNERGYTINDARDVTYENYLKLDFDMNPAEVRAIFEDSEKSTSEKDNVISGMSFSSKATNIYAYFEDEKLYRSSFSDDYRICMEETNLSIEQFKQLKLGMTLAEAEGVLGKAYKNRFSRTIYSSGPSDDTDYLWFSDEAIIRISLDSDYKISSISQQGLQYLPDGRKDYPQLSIPEILDHFTQVEMGIGFAELYKQMNNYIPLHETNIRSSFGGIVSEDTFSYKRDDGINIDFYFVGGELINKDASYCETWALSLKTVDKSDAQTLKRFMSYEDVVDALGAQGVLVEVRVGYDDGDIYETYMWNLPGDDYTYLEVTFLDGVIEDNYDISIYD